MEGPAPATKPMLFDRLDGQTALVTRATRGTAPAYRMSKAALNGLTAYLHGEYGPRGLIANAVWPGWVRTDMGGCGAPRSVDEGIDTIVWLCRFKPGSPSGRFWRDRAVIDW